MRVLALSLFLALVCPLSAHATETRVLEFTALEGWDQDDHAAALDVFLASCPRAQGAEWQSLCTLANSGQIQPRAFFERLFRPVLISHPREALFTGYFEPEIPASARRMPGFTVPVLSMPAGIQPGDPALTRAGIDRGALAGQGLELGWLRSPADLYYLQMQGSGRLVLDDGRMVRLGYGGQNGHPRRSISAEAVRRGIFDPHEASGRMVRAWVAANPQAGRALVQADPSYVFFRRIEAHPARLGPLGAIGVPLVPLRSLAVDPRFVPLGAPVWMERGAMRRLMIAQDTGGAIRGPQRGDIFFGTGDGAEEAARRVRDGGRMVVLMPVEMAFARQTEF